MNLQKIVDEALLELQTIPSNVDSLDVLSQAYLKIVANIQDILKSNSSVLIEQPEDIATKALRANDAFKSELIESLKFPL